jgi:hypothetical protein
MRGKERRREERRREGTRGDETRRDVHVWCLWWWSKSSRVTAPRKMVMRAMVRSKETTRPRKMREKMAVAGSLICHVITGTRDGERASGWRWRAA